MRNPTPVPSTTPAAPVPLSITLAQLPPGDVLRAYTLPVTADRVHHLVVIPDGATVAAVVRACRHLAAPVRSLAFAALGVPDPDTDPTGHEAARWWEGSQAFDAALIQGIERAGRLAVWRHPVDSAEVAR